MPSLTRITHDPNVMGGKPCIRGLRVTVGVIVGLLAAGRSREKILRSYPYLADEDISEALFLHSRVQPEDEEDKRKAALFALPRR